MSETHPRETTDVEEREGATIEAVTLFDRDGTRFMRAGEHDPQLFESDGELKEETTEVVEFDQPIPLGEIPDLACHSDTVREWMEASDE